MPLVAFLGLLACAAIVTAGSLVVGFLVLWVAVMLVT
jgi:hypothetical protein